MRKKILDSTKHICDCEDTNIIFWGAGCFLRNWDFKASGICCYAIIDSDISVAGKRIVLGEETYEILHPSILHTLNVEDCAIIITVQNENIVDEIFYMVKCNFPQWYDRLFRPNMIREVYDDIESNAAEKFKISTEEYIYKRDIQNAYKLIRRYINNDLSKCRYVTMDKASRLVVEIIDIQSCERYVIHFPPRKYECPSIFFSYESRYNNMQIRKKLGINIGQDIYEDEEGFQISRFIQNKDEFNETNICSMFEELLKIHKSGETVKIRLYPDELIGFYEKHVEICDFELKEIKRIIHGNEFCKEICNYESVLIHGDFHKNNVLVGDNQIYIIDWDSLQMGDPIYDICYFYYHFTQSNRESKLKDLLTIYYKRRVSQNEYIHAEAVMTLVCYLKWLEKLYIQKCEDDCIKNRLKKHISTYMNGGINI